MKKWVEKLRSCGRLFNFRPALFAAVFFALGMVFYYAYSVHGTPVLFGLLGLPALWAVLPFTQNRFSSALALALLTLCFSLGVIVLRAETERYHDGGRYTGKATVIGVVSEFCEYEDETWSIRIDEPMINDKREAYAFYGRLYKNEKIKLGDEVILRASISTDLCISERLRDFASGVRYQGVVERIAVVDRSDDLFLNARRRVYDTIYKGFKGDAAPVTYAILTGDDSGIAQGLLENVRMGGIAHIFAVSGLHIGALYAVCRALFERTKLNKLHRGWRFVFLTAILLFYGGICGFSASVVRATVMCLVVYATFLTGLKTDLLERTGIAAFLILLFNPASLFSLGFELSFAACLSIGIFARTVESWCSAGISKLPIKRKPLTEAQAFFVRKRKKAVCSFLGVTLAVQVGTAPITLLAFGRLPLWSLPLNCLFVPLLSAVFPYLLAAVFFSAILPLAAAPVLLYVPSVLLNGGLFVFHAVDFAACIRFALPAVALLPYYAAFVLVSEKINLGWRWKLPVGGLLLVGTILLTVF